MRLFSWGTSESHFKWSVISSKSQKMTFCKIWPKKKLATSKNVNFQFLIKKSIKINLFLLVNSFWMPEFWNIYVLGGGQTVVGSIFYYFYYVTWFGPFFGEFWGQKWSKLGGQNRKITNIELNISINLPNLLR